jgi:DNA replication and repair protein RecF
MINTSLSLTNFRNHHQTDVDWGEHVNIITGPNGAGKTNLIDALHYLCMGRSFTSSSDMYVVRQESSSFLVKGAFRGSIRSSFEVACSYSRGDGKRLWVNDSPLERHADLIGLVPVVLVSPDDRRLTGEGPAERRSFLDALISQTSPSYLDDLIRYRKIVRQRNRLLADIHMHPDQLDLMLEPWDRQLMETGSRIIARRGTLVRKFQSYLEQAHKELAGSGLVPSISYRTFCDIGDEPEPDAGRILQEYRTSLRGSAERERERRQTLTGPHRDELVFYLNDMELRKFGSQGQHRIFALALKMAQLYFYNDELEDLPVFLLDDVFGDLDPQRTATVMQMLLQHEGQSFITAAHPDKISGFTASGRNRITSFGVSGGRVEQTP